MNAAPLHERLAHLATTFYDKSYEEIGDPLDTVGQLREFLRDHAASIADFARICEQEYAPLSTDGDVPTNAQALALGRFLRPHFRTQDAIQRLAYVTRGGAGLPDDYLHVRFGDNYEGGIDREGRVST